VQEQSVEFYSEGERISGLLRTPDTGDGPRPGIVQGPGWLGLKDARLYLRYHEAMTTAGYAVLIFDYRGFGDSGGDRGMLSPRMQLEDLRNAVTYLTTRDDIDPAAIGAFGSGGTGGGNAVLLAAADERVRCAVSQVPVADGADWLRRMRASEAAWESFLARLAADREQRVLTGEGAMVHPREEIMIPTAERRATTVKKDVDGRIPVSVPLAAADEILAYRPVDAAPRVAPRGLLVVAVADDDVTPTDHATALYEAAGTPRMLIMQRNTTHYAAYEQYGDRVTPRIVEWFRAHFSGEIDPATDIYEVIE
jgi:dipeptidyl aminopeptidase/acylaminoacyl peptidase